MQYMRDCQSDKRIERADNKKDRYEFMFNAETQPNPHSRPQSTVFTAPHIDSIPGQTTPNTGPQSMTPVYIFQFQQLSNTSLCFIFLFPNITCVRKRVF